VYTGGTINELFVCNVNDVELPLGFEIHADAFGLNVSYENTDDNSTTMGLTTKIDSPVSNDMTSSLLSGNTFRTGRRRSTKGSRERSNEANKLKMLNFPGCTINKTSTQKFIVKNLSGIKTSFKFTSVNFEPISHIAP
jgi:hypothetical protein